jgi:hypothetical protein
VGGPSAAPLQFPCATTTAAVERNGALCAARGLKAGPPAVLQWSHKGG